MKKIVFLNAMVLFLVSAFATDTPAYAPHAFHPGYHPVYGHGLHLRPVPVVHKHMRPGTAFFVRGNFTGPMSVAIELPSVQVSLPAFTKADAAINEAAVMEMTEISIPGFVAADEWMNQAAVMEMTEISIPDFLASDAAIEALAAHEMTRITLPGFFESDAAISEAAIMELTEISVPGVAAADAEIDAEFSRES